LWLQTPPNIRSSGGNDAVQARQSLIVGMQRKRAVESVAHHALGASAATETSSPPPSPDTGAGATIGFAQPTIAIKQIVHLIGR
jgi:hypothetical protein